MMHTVQMRMLFVAILAPCLLSRLQADLLTEFRPYYVPNVIEEERAALQDLYDSTAGVDWDWNYNTGIAWNFTDPSVNPCTEQWAGVNCSFTPPYQTYYVSAIILHNFGLVGSLPDTIGNFQYLAHLRLDENSITGTLPETIGNLANLTTLRLQGNSFHGPIPGTLGKLTALIECSLERNRFTGSLPAELGNLSSIISLHVGTNRLTGTLPASLGQLITLRHAIFFFNNLNGTIPDSFGDMTDLVALNLYNNTLTGTVPTALCNLVNMTILTLGYNAFSQTIPSCLSDLPQLKYLNLFANALTGPIPDSFAQMTQLGILYLNHNQLTGSTEVLCHISSLGQLYLAKNLFTGTMSECLSGLTNLTSLYLASNQHLYGTIPESWGSLGRLRYLDLSSNAISGALPQSFAQLSDLTFLYLFDNKLTGTVPQAYSQLRNLTLLLLQNNQLSGPVDKVFNSAVQRHLNTIQLSGNAFTGELPGESLFLNSPVLTGFAAVDNCFRGSVPASLCACASLRLIALDGASSSKRCSANILPGLNAWQTTDTAFGGEIPHCLFQMPKLTVLHLSGLRLTGSLPSNLTLGPNLGELALTHNSLSGRIPRSVQQRVWHLLDLSYNRFSGTLEDTFNTVPVHINLTAEVPPVGAIVHDFTSTNSFLALKNNRLSGRIPHTAFSLPNLTILTGNLFACDWESSDLPPNDSGRTEYECGSAAVNSQLYSYIIIVGVGAAVSAALYSYRASVGPYVDVQALVDHASKWLRALHEPALQTKLQSFKRVCDTADLIGRVAVGSAALIVAILIPLYATLTHFYGTATYQYAWSISAAFLSGVVPFVLQFITYLSILAASLYMLRYTKDRLVTLLPNLPDQTATPAHTVVDEMHPVGTVTWSQLASAHFTFFIVNLVIVTGVNIAFVVIVLSGDKAGLTAAQLFLSFFKGFWNSIGVSRLMNWSFRRILEANPSKAATLKTHLAASLFNNIGIPCLVVAAISPDCFYNVFRAPHSTSFLYLYLTCAVFLDDKCRVFLPIAATTTYVPPFTYSYECGAQYITSYAATFLYLALEVAFIIPIVPVLLTMAHKRAAPGGWWRRALHPIIIKPLKSLGDAADFDDNGVLKTGAQFFDARQLMVLLLTYLSILLSFGVVFPPIAVVMAIAVVSIVFCNRLTMGRYLSNAMDLDQEDKAEAPEKAHPPSTTAPSEEAGEISSSGIARVSRGEQYICAVEMDARKIGALHAEELRSCVGMVLMCCCLFYTIFFFDTLGNAYGVEASVWVFFAWPLVPLGLHARIAWNGSGLKDSLTKAVFGPQKKSRGTGGGAEASGEPECGDVELSTMQATVNPLADA